MADSPFDRPTDRVRKIMPLAREHAARLGNDAVEPSHVFLAILEEGTGVAAAILRGRISEAEGLDFATLRAAIEAELPPPGGAVGPELPFASRTRELLEATQAEAEALGHDYVGSEHVLLGLARVGHTVLAAHLPTGEPITEPLRREVRAFVGDAPAG